MVVLVVSEDVQTESAHVGPPKPSSQTHRFVCGSHWPHTQKPGVLEQVAVMVGTGVTNRLTVHSPLRQLAARGLSLAPNDALSTWSNVLGTGAGTVNEKQHTSHDILSTTTQLVK